MKIDNWADKYYSVTKGKYYKDLTTKTDLWFTYGTKYFNDCLGTKKEAEEMLLYLQKQRWFAKVLGWITCPSILFLNSYGVFYTPSVKGKVALMTQDKWGIWHKGPLSYEFRHNLTEVKNDVE